MISAQPAPAALLSGGRGPGAALTSGQTARSHPSRAGCNRPPRGQVLPGQAGSWNAPPACALGLSKGIFLAQKTVLFSLPEARRGG